MNKLWASMLAAVLAILLSGAALAQSDAPAVDPENPEPSSYLTLDMSAGFALDPFVVSLNGGGEVDASTLDPACAGYINDKPVMTTRWVGSVDSLRVFYFSSADSTLVVKQPDGSYLCGDDVSENVLDAELTITNPVTGTYELWIGNYDDSQLIPGLLVVTARPDVDLSSFDPGKLVNRPVIDAEPAPETDESAAAQEAVTAEMKFAPASVISAASGPITATIVTTGTTPGFLLNADTSDCSGLVEDMPDYIVNVEGDVDHLRVFFEADNDATLIVVAKDAGPFCADNTEDELNANPVVDIPTPQPGLYGIFVGRFGEDEPITGTLTISADPAVQPAILAPAAPATPEP